MGRFVDLTGQRFGRLIAIERCKERAKHGKSVKWKCVCDCGNEVIVASGLLKSGATKSCGCLKKEQLIINGKSNLGKRRKWNRYEIHDDYAIGYDDKGNFFIIDIEDLEEIKSHYWYLGAKGYWMSQCTYQNGENKHLKMHKILCRTEDGQVVDHINRDKNDNRKCNLRACTITENNRNSTIAKNNTSGVIGVTWNKERKKWKAYVIQSNNGKNPEIFLGWFDNKEDAIKARLQGELKYYGMEFAPQRNLFEQYGII